MASAPEPTSAGWSPRFWAFSVVLVFLVQAALVFWLSEANAPRRVGPKAGAEVAFLAEELRWGRDPALVPWQEPTAFSLAHPFGFSGPLWNQPPGLAHEAYESPDEPEWLALDPSNLGLRVPGLRPAAAITAPARLEPPAPTKSAVQVPGLSLPDRSRLQFEHRTVAERLRNPPKLPVLSYTNLLQPTVVAFTFLPSGYILSARLIQSSGLSSADQRALELTRNFQLGDPALADAPVWGQAVTQEERVAYEWQVTEPSGNSAPAGAARSE